MSNKRTTVLIIISYTLFYLNNAAIVGFDFDKLNKIGVVQGRVLNYKIKGDPMTKDLVLKFIPNIVNITECVREPLSRYNETVRRLLLPIHNMLGLYLNNTNAKMTGLMIAGVIMGGIAIGIATAAQITAGFALYEAKKNTENIQKLTDSIMKTQDSIDKLTDSVGTSILILNKLQTYINNQLVPNLELLSCRQNKIEFDLMLTKYLVDLMTVIGPNINNPVNKDMTIQSLSLLFDGNYDIMMSELGYTPQDFLDLIESKSITGQIIYVDMENLYVVIRTYLPTLIEVPDAQIYEFNKITMSSNGGEYLSTIPNFILIRGNYMSNIDVATCYMTKASVICNQDYSLPMSQNLRSCYQGETEYCPVEAVIASHSPRFALTNGVIFANCINTICRCQDNGKTITQNINQFVSMIDNSTCNDVMVDKFTIKVGKYMGRKDINNINIQIGPQIIIDKVDLSNEINKMNQSLKDSIFYLREAKRILDSVNISLISPSVQLFLIIISVLSFIILLIIIVYLYCKSKHSYKYNKFIDDPDYYNDYKRERINGKASKSNNIYYVGD
ncbi:fusion glycoprotein [Cedar virus]|uniref:Fusion glycoprotein F0 n=1 Tax=Cedar virus TaxID=1221391 RepID=J7GX38_9MONO|nr:fusion glycoprotein [Cedar virus]AFP87278.1 fusion glycoprotein [Cedar virus]